MILDKNTTLSKKNNESWRFPNCNELSYTQQSSKKSSQQEVGISTGLMISNDNLFDKNLNLLKEFSRQLPQEINLPTVATKGNYFGFFDHNVTGEELNQLTENIQDRIIEQNKATIKIVGEFEVIYKTFAALDEVYVKEIVSAIKIAFKAIDETIVNNKKISEQQKDISRTQQDIKELINQQKNIIQVLKNFKEKLEALQHLYDIDKIFSEVHAFQTKVATLEQISAEQKFGMDKISELLESMNVSNDMFNKEVKNELTALRNESSIMFRPFVSWKSIAIVSITSLFVILILFVTEVLR